VVCYKTTEALYIVSGAIPEVRMYNQPLNGFFAELKFDLQEY